MALRASNLTSAIGRHHGVLPSLPPRLMVSRAPAHVWWSKSSCGITLKDKTASDIHRLGNNTNAAS
eukprot:1157768-Pelagomonas_calceolata.AAC.4